MTKRAILALADGTTFEGDSFGAPGEATGEVVFNTSMTGYQEILTDPSYVGQMVCMTYPEQGNYGVNRADQESERPHATASWFPETPPAVLPIAQRTHTSGSALYPTRSPRWYIRSGRIPSSSRTTAARASPLAWMSERTAIFTRAGPSRAAARGGRASGPCTPGPDP